MQYDSITGIHTKETYNEFLKLLSSESVTNASGLILHGPAKYYYPDGTLSHCGYFKYGYKDSLWTFYNTDGTTMIEKRIYRNKQNAFAYQLFDSSLHHIIEEGNMDEHERKHGEIRKYFTDTILLKYTGTYIHGKKSGEHIEYFRNRQIKRQEWFENGKLKKAVQYDEKGNKSKYYPAFSYPEPPEKLYKYLPLKSACYNQLLLTGDITIQCFIEEDGRVKWVNILHGGDEQCVKELKQIIRSMKAWKPATIEGTPSSFVYKTKLHRYQASD